MCWMNKQRWSRQAERDCNHSTLQCFYHIFSRTADPVSLFQVYDGHSSAKYQAKLYFLTWGMQLNQQVKRMCKIFIGEVIIVWSKYFKIRFWIFFSIHYRKIFKLFCQKISEWLLIKAALRNFSANFINCIYQNGVLFIFSANKRCDINSEHGTNWFAWIFKSYHQKPALVMKTSNIFIFEIYSEPKFVNTKAGRKGKNKPQIYLYK